jgi:hypothetical protein
MTAGLESRSTPHFPTASHLRGAPAWAAKDNIPVFRRVKCHDERDPNAAVPFCRRSTDGAVADNMAFDRFQISESIKRKADRWLPQFSNK